MTFVQKRLVGLGVLVLAAGLGALAIYGQQEKLRQDDAEKKVEEKVLRVASANDIAQVALQSAKGRFVMARQDSGGWRLVEPIATAADEVTANALARYLAELRRTRLVGEPRPEGGVTPPPDLGIFGLSPPRFEITLTRKDGQNETLLVGARNDFDGSIYVKTPEAAEVQLVAGGIDYQVDKDLLAWREKRLVVFEPADVTRLHVKAGKHEYTVERRNDGFALTHPVTTAADESQINGILQALASLRAEAFLSEHASAKELAQRGLDKPAATAELALKSGGKIEITLAEGKDSDRAVVYAALKGDSPIIEISSDWALRKVLTAVTDLRDKRVLRFSRDLVRAISIKKGEQTLRLEQRRQEKKGDEEDDERWFITAPESGEADDSVVSGLLYRLESMRARKIVSEQAGDAAMRAHGLDEPTLQVDVLGEGGAALATLRIREMGGVWHASASSTGRIDEVAAEDVSDLSAAAADYKPRAESE